MRILVVIHGFPPTAQGGSEIYAYAHARALHDIFGDEILVLTRDQDRARPEYDVRRDERDGLRIVSINNTFRTTRGFDDTYRNPMVGGIASRLIDEFQPDVAHIHHLTCLSTAIVPELRRRSVPSIFTLHDYWLMCHRGQLLDLDYQRCDGPGRGPAAGCDRCLGAVAGAPPVAFAARSIIRRLPEGAARHVRGAMGRLATMSADAGTAEREARNRVAHMRAICDEVTHFIAPSRHMRDRFVRFGVAPERITVAGYGFDPAPFRALARTRGDRLRLGFLGSLMISKAPHLLLEAAARLPRGAASVDLFGAECAYHGDTSYRDVMAPLLGRPDVRLVGPLAHEDVPRALASLDVLVVPSIWEENSPLVIREAFLAGVPVVASRIGGVPEAVEHGRNGLLFEPGDADDLRRTLQRLLDEPDLLDTLRAGVPPVRTIAEDVTCARALYEQHVSPATRDGFPVADARRPEGRPARRPGATGSFVTVSRPAAPDVFPSAPVAPGGFPVPVAPGVPAGRLMRIAAVVLNYGTPDDTLLAVKSLLASRRPLQDIIVVDNSRNGDCRAALRDVLAHVTCIQAERNLGFSAGMNVGIREALGRGTDAVLLVNSDLIVPPDCIGLLDESLYLNAGAGIAGPVVLSRTDPDRIASLGMSFTPPTGRMRHRGAGTRVESIELAGWRTVDAIDGCLMLIRRQVFDAIGLLDEDYFFTFEDLDFCLRARRAGFSTGLTGAAVAYHEGSRSIGAGSSRHLYFAARNHLLMASRAARGPNTLMSAARAVSIVLLNLAHAVLSAGDPLPRRLSAVIRGTRDHCRGRYGPDPEAARSVR